MFAKVFIPSTFLSNVGMKRGNRLNIIPGSVYLHKIAKSQHLFSKTCHNRVKFIPSHQETVYLTPANYFFSKFEPF